MGGDSGGKKLYEFVKKNTASLSDNKKIVETNKRRISDKKQEAFNAVYLFPTFGPQMHVSNEKKDSAMPHKTVDVRVL